MNGWAMAGLAIMALVYGGGFIGAWIIAGRETKKRSDLMDEAHKLRLELADLKHERAMLEMERPLPATRSGAVAGIYEFNATDRRHKVRR